MEDIISHFSYTFIKGSLNKKYPHPNALKLLFYNFGKTSINFFAQLTLAHMTMMSLHMTMTSSSCFGHLQTLPKPIKLRKTLVSPWTTIRVGSAASTLTQIMEEVVGRMLGDVSGTPSLFYALDIYYLKCLIKAF